MMLLYHQQVGTSWTNSDIAIFNFGDILTADIFFFFFGYVYAYTE